MPDFAYQALDRSGATVAGVLQADNQDAVAERVRQLGLFPTAVNPAREQRRAEAPAPAVRAGAAGGRVNRMDVVLFTRQMADLVEAGLPLDRALTVLQRQTDSAALRARVAKLQEEVRAGKPLSEALSLFPREFPDLFVNMVHAGESTGQLGQVLERLASYLEREMTRRAQLLSALTYPTVLICVAFSAIAFLLAFVIPKLSTVFDELGKSLPLPTLILLAVVGFLTHYWWALLLGIAAAALGARQLLRTPGGRAAWDAAKFRLPLAGKLQRRLVSSRFVRALGTMLHGGVPILDSLEIARDAVGNVGAARAVERVREAIRQGESLAEAMAGTEFFLPVAVHMAAVGEETGRLPAMLVRTADSLDFEIDSQVRRLVTLVEPLIVLLMGAFVGFVVLSVLLPVFEANLAVS